MVKVSTKALKTGLGIRGIVGAIVLGAICLFPPLFGNATGFLWALILLFVAALVYVIFSFVWDKRYLPLTNIQLLVAIALLGITIATGQVIVIALGLCAHAVWDLWHLATSKRYVPWWYAGACIYVDLAAAALIILKR